MLTTDDREILEKTATHAMQFVFDHDEDDILCQLTQVLVGMMYNICQRDRQELVGSRQAMPESQVCPENSVNMSALRGHAR